jgi:hypothetical protein
VSNKEREENFALVSARGDTFFQQQLYSEAADAYTLAIESAPVTPADLWVFLSVTPP